MSVPCTKPCHIVLGVAEIGIPRAEAMHGSAQAPDWLIILQQVLCCNPADRENQLGSECFATPTPIGDRLYHRYAVGTGAARQEYLAAIGE